MFGGGVETEVEVGGRAMGGQRVEDGRPPSNLQRFLDCTTPAVQTHILPKVTPPSPTARALRCSCSDVISADPSRPGREFFFFKIICTHYSSADLFATAIASLCSA